MALISHQASAYPGGVSPWHGALPLPCSDRSNIASTRLQLCVTFIFFKAHRHWVSPVPEGFCPWVACLERDWGQTWGFGEVWAQEVFIFELS